MATPLKQIQPVLAFAVTHLDEDVSPTALAAKAACRVFSAVTGERRRPGRNRATESPQLRLGFSAGRLASIADQRVSAYENKNGNGREKRAATGTSAGSTSPR